jgi:two-component system KDP operon response regulator KdpE
VKMEPYALLLIARAQSLAERLRSALDPEQYLIRWVPSTSQAVELDLRPSLLVLDLPPTGGIRCSSRLKQRFGAPLLVLLQSGQAAPTTAEASVTRPVSTEQFADTIRTTLMTCAPHSIRVDGMSLDTRTRRLELNGTLHQLPPIGCQILALLMEHCGSAVPREELFRRVWRTDDGDNTRVLDVHIAHLRRMLEPNPRRPQLILTERRVGYRLQPPG